jgi:hypothetical protein
MTCTQIKCTSIRMGRINTARALAAELCGFIVCVCFVFFGLKAATSHPQGAASVEAAPKQLDSDDLLGLLDCATRPDQILAVQPDFYDADGLRMRYVYPVLPGRETNMLNSIGPSNRVALLLYHRDNSSAALFEVGIDGPHSTRTFILLDAANVEAIDTKWAVKDILNGGVSTWPEIARHVDQMPERPLVRFSRSVVKRTTASCEFPKRGMLFAAVSSSGDKSNWNFKNGASEGIRFKSQNGPFDNSDLKRVPFARVYMNFYGPS